MSRSSQSKETLPPPNYDTLLYLIKQMKSTVGEITSEIDEVKSVVIRTEVNLENLTKLHEKLANDVADVHNIHSDCPARRDIAGVNARLKRLEERDWEDLKERADASQNVDLTKQRADAAREAAEAKKQAEENAGFRGLFSKYLVELIIVMFIMALLGTAAGVYMVTKMISEDKVVPELPALPSGD
jgi:hypothetical protein